MASKSKKQAQRHAQKQDPLLALMLCAVLLGILALVQNKYGQWSDVRGFFGMHFRDGLHHWPYSPHTIAGTSEVMHSVEYPVITGLVMWLLTFLVPMSDQAIIHYYWITAAFNILLLATSAYLIKSISNKKTAYYFIFAPAVLYSLYRNWDIWALVPMLSAILLFEREKYSRSAWMLSLSIATKFFPLVLLLPIGIIFIRKNQISILIKYCANVLISWIIINLPFALIDFRGWSYFYEYSYKRGLGSASIYEIISILIPSISFSSPYFYLFNFVIFSALIIYLFKINEIPTLAESSFFVVFAFILFTKQYSMQYVIWLAPLAVITMEKVSRKNKEILLYLYILWQAFELVFQYSFFQKMLTDHYRNTSTPMTISVSNTMYASIGAIRYIVAILFTVILCKFFYDGKKAVQGQK
jgi:uncharacterized membrane protein